MKHLLYFILAGMLLCSGQPAYAQEKITERVYIHLDKDYYIAGEPVRMKFLALDGECRPSDLSKVGYVEISGTERPYVQFKLALFGGSGQAMAYIPAGMPSGIYQLSGYTRYMKNEGNGVFFKKQIAIINPRIRPDKSKAEFMSGEEVETIKPGGGDIGVFADKNEYGNREMVRMHVSGLPENLVDLVISVSGIDSISSVPLDVEYNVKDVRANALSGEWLPEYEGHIITGRLYPKPDSTALMANLSVVGRDIKYINGRINRDGETVSFYTTGIYGPQEIVASVTSVTGEAITNRLDVMSPFSEDLPQRLPVLRFYPSEKQIMDRYVAAQLSKVMEADTVSGRVDMDYYDFPVTRSYNLDDYTRFNTLSETILEFVHGVAVRKTGNVRRISIFSGEQLKFNKDNTLILLDGIPIFNHEDILEYNPRNIKTVDIYDGRYIFANELYEGIVSFVTYSEKLPFFKLNDLYQLFRYEFPRFPVQFEHPDYTDAAVAGSRLPDMRHTLYWNASAKPDTGREASFSFFTSDLCGDFKIAAEGITSDGRVIKGSAVISVVKK